MTDPRIEKLAKVLTHYSLELKKGDFFRIDGPYLAEPLIRAVYKEAILIGAYPYTQITIDGLSEIFYRYGSEEQLKYISEIDRLAIEKLSALLTVWADWNTKSLTNADPKKMAIHQGARRELFNRLLERISTRDLRWCGTLFPNQASAQDAEMSLTEYEDFVFNAGLLDKEDPINEWQNVSKEQEKLADLLTKKKEIHIKGIDTDLTFSVEGRKWVNCNGQENFPDGEIFTSPIEDSAQGTIRYTFPAVYRGREVLDVRLTFEKGKVIKAQAAKGEEFLLSMIDMDEGARYIGEFSFGTNYGIQRFTKNTLFDEKIGGTIHIALGAALPESGGKNKSALHWDMVCDLRPEGEVYADGELIFKNGKFLII